MTDNRDEWTPDAPPGGFSDRMMDRIAMEAPPVTEAPQSTRPHKLHRRRSYTRMFAGVSAVALAASVAMFVRGGSGPAEGQATADVRREVALGSRALAVLDNGAEVSWRGDDVTQRRGDVFYRVEKGKRFTVHTPVGRASERISFATRSDGERKEKRGATSRRRGEKARHRRERRQGTEE